MVTRRHAGPTSRMIVALSGCKGFESEERQDKNDQEYNKYKKKPGRSRMKSIGIVLDREDHERVLPNRNAKAVRFSHPWAASL